MIESLLTGPYWVIDFLPEQVPAESPGRFFEAERFFLSEEYQPALRRRFADILLKLNCYDDLEVGTPDDKAMERNPAPEDLYRRVTQNRQDLCVLLPDENALITLNRDELCMTLYNPPEKLLRRAERLAAAEGLFVWQPPQDVPGGLREVL